MSAPSPSRAALVPTPRLIRDPSWERRALGSAVRRARAELLARLDGAPPSNDVARVLELAYDAVPFYQRLFARLAIGRRDLRDPRVLAAIPRTTRGELGAHGVGDFLVHPIDDLALDRGWLGKTSGSTGEPVSYLRDPSTLAWFWSFLDFVLAYVQRPPVRRGARFGVVLLDALAHMPEYDAELPLFHGARFAKRSIERGDRSLRDELVTLAPHVITGDPDSLSPLARLDLPKGARPSLVVSSAFAMPASQKRAIEHATSAAVIEYYGAQETSVIGVECRRGHGFHPLTCHVKSREGELLVTPLRARSFVLVHYAPGDLGRVIDDGLRCPCGLRAPRIVELHGRADARFVGADGSQFSPGALTPLLARLPIEEHQLVQRDASRYLLRYRATSELGAEALAALRTRLRELSRVEIAITLERSDRLHHAGRKPTPFVTERS